MSKIIKICFLIIIPILLGFVLFFPYKTPLQITKNQNDKDIISVPNFIELNENPGFSRMIRGMLATPFNLKYYVIVIKDIADYNGSIGGLGYFLYLDGEKQPFLESNEETTKIVRLVDKAQDIILEVEVAAIQGDAKSGERVNFTIDFESYARPSYWDVFTKIILVLIAWNGIFLIGKETYNFIFKQNFK